jgi:hypothetical protein
MPVSALFVGNCIVTFFPAGFTRVLASAIASCRARIESALSNSSYYISSSSSVVSYVSTELVEGGALSLPLIEVLPLCVVCGCGGADGAPSDCMATSLFTVGCMFSAGLLRGYAPCSRIVATTSAYVIFFGGA